MRIKAVILVGLLFSIQVTTVSASVIVVKEADSVWEIVVEHSGELENAARGVLPRIAVRYSSSLYSQSLCDVPQEVAQIAIGVLPRIAVRHSSSLYTRNLCELPIDLTQITKQVRSRILVKSAKSLSRLTLTSPAGQPSKSITKGDVNGDGEINILDVVKVINHIIEKAQLTGDEFLYADVAPFDESGQPGGDGTVDILDIVGIVDMILYSGEHGVAARIAIKRPILPSPAVLRLSREGPDYFTIDLDSGVPVAGLQLRVQYNSKNTTPPTVLTTERSSEMSLSWNVIEDGLIVLLYGQEGETLPPGNGPVIQIQESGNGSLVTVEQLVLSDLTASQIPVHIETAPLEYALSPNHPNPTNMGTTIRYQLPEKERVKLTIYSITGQVVRVLVNEVEEPGYKSVYWDGKDETGSNVSNGIYLYKMDTGKFSAVKKMVIVK